jgi:hypothetical protein
MAVGLGSVAVGFCHGGLLFAGDVISMERSGYVLLVVLS